MEKERNQENETALRMSFFERPQQSEYSEAKTKAEAAEPFLQGIRQSKIESFGRKESELMMQNVVTPAFEIIEGKIGDFVFYLHWRVHKKFANLTINELGRWFYLKIKITKFRCVVLTTECEINFDESVSKTRHVIAEKIIDCRQGREFQITDVLNFFSDVFLRRFKLYDEIIEKENQQKEIKQKIFKEEKKLALEKIRNEYLELRRQNDDLDDDVLETNFVDRIIRTLFRII